MDKMVLLLFKIKAKLKIIAFTLIINDLVFIKKQILC